MVADMCAQAGIDGRKTNHSLRVTGTSSLFEAGVPERIIQSHNGSLDALHMYEEEQNLAVS